MHVVDQYGNTVADGTAVVASQLGGTGILTGTFTELMIGGNATFNDFQYHKSADPFQIVFTSNTYTVTSTPITMSAGLVTAVTIATAPASTGTVDNPLSTSPVINLKDQYGNNAPGIGVAASLGERWFRHCATW